MVDVTEEDSASSGTPEAEVYLTLEPSPVTESHDDGCARRLRMDLPSHRVLDMRARAARAVRSLQMRDLDKQNRRIHERLLSVHRAPHNKHVGAESNGQQHRRTLRCRREAHKAASAQYVAKIRAENSMMARRLSAAAKVAKHTSGLDFARQDQKRQLKEKRCRKKREENALLADPTKLDPHAKRQDLVKCMRAHQKILAELPPTEPYVLRPARTRRLMEERLASGMYQAPRATKLRIAQLGRQLNGHRFVFSVYESTEASKFLYVEAYEQANSRTHALRISHNEAMAALGLLPGDTLLGAEYRAELCSALVGQVDAFAVDGAKRLVLMHREPNSGKQTTALGRAKLAKEGKLRLRDGSVVHRIKGSAVFEQSTQVLNSVSDIIAVSHVRGQPIPELSLATRATGVLTASGILRPTASALGACPSKAEDCQPPAEAATCAMEEPPPPSPEDKEIISRLARPEPLVEPLVAVDFSASDRQSKISRVFSLPDAGIKLKCEKAAEGGHAMTACVARLVLSVQVEWVDAMWALQPKTRTDLELALCRGDSQLSNGLSAQVVKDIARLDNC